jgi:hypothetical protein
LVLKWWCNLKNDTAYKSVVVITLLCVFMTNGSALGQLPPFNKGSLKGPYEVMLNVWASKANVTNQVSVGILIFDGVGAVTCALTINTAGKITTDTFKGTYSVSANGSGSISMKDSSNKTIALALAIGSPAKNLQLLQTNPNGDTAVMTGTATAQGSGPFSNASLKGGYAVLETSWITTSDSSSSPVPIGVVAVVTFDGVGKVSSFSKSTAGGVSKSGTSHGTYSVNSDGTSTVNLTDNKGNLSTFTVVLNSSGKGFQFFWANCDCGNSAVAGTGVHQ